MLFSACRIQSIASGGLLSARLFLRSSSTHSAQSRSLWSRGFSRPAMIFCCVGIGTIGVNSWPSNSSDSKHNQSVGSVINRILFEKVYSLLEEKYVCHAEKAPEKKAEFIEITEGKPRTLLGQLKVTVVATSLFFYFTAVAPTVIFGSWLIPLIFGIKPFVYFLLASAIINIVPLTYSRQFRGSSFSISLWQTVSQFFGPMQFVRPAQPFDASKSYIFSFHPHGRLFVGTTLFMGLFPRMFPELWKTQDLFAGANDILLYIPFVWQPMRLMGSIGVGRESLVGAMRGGNSVLLVPGGIQEVLEGTFDDRDVVYLARRKGFCKLAMEQGAGVVPVFSFGENALFHHDSPLRLAFWRWLNQYARVGVPFPILGPYGLPVPRSVQLRVVVGEPLFAAPGETLTAFHARYVAALEGLYARHVADSAFPNKRLVVH